MIEISKLTKTYDRGTKALKDVNITIDDGEFVFITGRSGSGKSTLIKILLKEVEPTSGRVVVNDMDLRKMPRRYVPKYRRRLGVVFQDFRLLKDKTVYENVAFAQRVVVTPIKEIKKNVPAMLSLVGLAEKYKSFPRQLSGGEQRRLSLLRALSIYPQFLVLDEVTSGLDLLSTDAVLQVLERYHEEFGCAYLLITHDRQTAYRISSRVLELNRGVFVREAIRTESI